MPDVLTTEAWGRPVPESATEREQDKEYALEVFARSSEYREPRLTTLQELIDNYLVVPYGYSRFMAVPRLGHPSIASPGLATPSRRRRSISKDPETHQNVEALVAQSLGTMLGPPEYLSCLPVGSDDYEKSRLLGMVIRSVLESPGNFRTIYQTFKDAHITGTSILEFGWQVRSRQQLVEVPVLDENGELVEFTYRPDNVVYQEGPYIGQLDIFDAYPDPTGTRIQRDMVWFGKRFRIAGYQAEQLAGSGKYDKEGVRRALDRKGHAKEHEQIERDRYDMTARSMPEKLGILTGLEMWGYCPYSHADGASNRVVTLLSGELVRSTINPLASGQIPFQEVTVNPMTGQFYGLSSSEVNRFLQDSLDNMLSLLSDASELMVRPAMLAGIGLGAQVERIQYRGLNDVIACNNPDALKSIPSDFGALQVGQSEHGRRKLQMREAAGSALPQLVSTSKDGRTATESTEIARLASQRQELQVLLWERDTMPFIGKMLHQLLRQFMGDEAGMAMLDKQAVPFTLRDIDFDADVRFVGSRQARSKYQQGLALNNSIQTIASAMPLIPVMPELFVRLLRDVNDIVDAEEILKRAVTMVGMMNQQEAQSKSGSVARPGGGPAFTETGTAEQEGQALQ